MVKTVKIFRNNQLLDIPLSDFFIEFHKELPPDSKRIFEVISELYQIKNSEDQKRVANFLWIEFDLDKILKEEERIRKMNLPFDEETIKFIAFLKGTEYFRRIGNPDIMVWLNAKDINHPFQEVQNISEGFSLLEAVNYQYGVNAVKSRLLTALKWLRPQEG